MKHLTCRLARVAHSSQYTLLRSDSQSRRSRWVLAAASWRNRRHRVRTAMVSPSPSSEGHVPIYVGEEMRRFEVNTELLNHPIFMNLLNRSTQEYGYEPKGMLRIPCHVIVFERILEALHLGIDDTRDLHDLLCSSSEEFC